MPGPPGPRGITAGFPELPPRQAMLRMIYWGTFVLATVLVCLTSWYIQRIPAELLAEARERLSHHSWLQPLVFVDGRDLALRGAVEPGAGLDRDIGRLGAIPGVRTVSNQLEVVPRPAPRFILSWRDGKVGLEGGLAGNDLDRVVAGVRQVFPETAIQDRIRIDDRLGHPLWLDRLAPMLRSLAALETFTLYAWRDRILVDGVGDTAARLEDVRYRAPAGLDPSVIMSFRLRPAPAPGQATLSLVSGWNGTSLAVSLDDGDAAQALEHAMEGLEAFGDHAAAVVNLDPELRTPPWFGRIAGVIPLLGEVHDLRMVSGGRGLWLWGRVDHGSALGRTLAALEAAGLGDVVVSRLEVDPAGRPAEVSLFRDRHRAVLNGRLPNLASRALLLDTLRKGLNVAAVEDFITLEPGISYSPWLERWPALLPVLPDSPFGLTVSGERALVSGHVSSGADHEALIRALQSMLPGKTLVDWLTVTAED